HRLIPRGIPYQLDPDVLDPGDGAYRRLDHARHLAGHRTARGGQGHVDVDIPGGRDVAAVDEAELVDVDRDLRVVDAPQGVDHRQVELLHARGALGRPRLAIAHLVPRVLHHLRFLNRPAFRCL